MIYSPSVTSSKINSKPSHVKFHILFDLTNFCQDMEYWFPIEYFVSVFHSIIMDTQNEL